MLLQGEEGYPHNRLKLFQCFCDQEDHPKRVRGRTEALLCNYSSTPAVELEMQED